ncbi:PREDICTED: uncharacterized protein LOC106806804 [Priapulus caudatus]|uniref:Uncharacterized protein LOC106806804 n=1 Tax=Priapulus caudatus TaxID=37621 RepID=A0ABM1DWQ0_PRICU|nr:PREDICTED: uncharacterized protein LOC106806804 [Priapulus caudatus]
MVDEASIEEIFEDIDMNDDFKLDVDEDSKSELKQETPHQSKLSLETLAAGQEIIMRQLNGMQSTLNLLANRFLGMPAADEQVVTSLPLGQPAKEEDKFIRATPEIGAAKVVSKDAEARADDD